MSRFFLFFSSHTKYTRKHLYNLSFCLFSHIHVHSRHRQKHKQPPYPEHIPILTLSPTRNSLYILIVYFHTQTHIHTRTHAKLTSFTMHYPPQPDRMIVYNLNTHIHTYTHMRKTHAKLTSFPRHYPPPLGLHPPIPTHRRLSRHHAAQLPPFPTLARTRHPKAYPNSREKARWRH